MGVLIRGGVTFINPLKGEVGENRETSLEIFQTKLGAYLRSVLMAGVTLAASEDGNGVLQAGRRASKVR